MKSRVFAVMTAAVTLVACSDEKTLHEIVAPGSEAVTPAPQMSMSGGNGSSVCRAFQKDLADIGVLLAQAPSDANLIETKAALEAMATDVCN